MAGLAGQIQRKIGFMIKPPFHLKVRRPARENLEPHEVFLDRLAQRREEEISESENKIEKPLPERKLWLLFLGVSGIFSILLVCSFWLQVVRGDEYAARAAGNQFIVSSMRAERGVIYDRHFNQLVHNQTVYRLVVESSKIPADSEKEIWLLRRLADFTGKPLGDIWQKIEESEGRRIVLQEDLTYDQVIFWETKSEEWSGVDLERHLMRRYAEEGGWSHVLGYVSRADREGAAGLEKEYDGHLCDRIGHRQIERDARGNILQEEVVQEPEPGDSLVLHLDHELQVIMEKVLREKMEEVGSREANAVALDPRNGAVRALVSIPGYDNNIFNRFISAEEIAERTSDPDFSLFNQAISGIGYATGSVIKPLIGVAVLEEGIIDPDRRIYAAERICIPHAYTGQEQCFRDWRYHGMTDLRRAIAESVNTYFYMVGGGYQNIAGLGPNRIKDWLERFGWSRATGIDLPNEGRGALPEIDNNWRLGNTYHLSIGQGQFSVTPLQVASAYAALANGGILYQPQVVHQVVRQAENGREVVHEFEPVITNPSVARYENIKIVQEGMRQAVTQPRASAYALNDLPVTSAVKTGTAQTGRDRVYHNWIALFAPYEDPELVLVFMIRDVAESMVAVRSVAYDVLNLYFGDKGDKFSQDEGS